MNASAMPASVEGSARAASPCARSATKAAASSMMPEQSVARARLPRDARRIGSPCRVASALAGSITKDVREQGDRVDAVERADVSASRAFGEASGLVGMPRCRSDRDGRARRTRVNELVESRARSGTARRSAKLDEIVERASRRDRRCRRERSNASAEDSLSSRFSSVLDQCADRRGDDLPPSR